MKQLKYLLPFCIIIFVNVKTFAQECMVVPEALKGKYEGGCDKGKANGKGKAYGYDSYEGEFKNGYPDGAGAYTWKDGHYFIGNYKKGYMEGMGEMFYESYNGLDSIIKGFWKKNVYVGLYEKPYEIIAMSGRVSKINCRIADKKGVDINVNVTRTTGGVASIIDIIIVQGTFYKHNTQIMTNMSYTRIQEVTFPLKVIFTFSTGETSEIIFNEKAQYDVDIQII